jgi:hypothetical protein
MKSQTASVMRGRRLARPPVTRTAAAVIAVAVLAMMAASCSSGSPSSAGPGGSRNAGQSASSPTAVGYSACIRARGVPNFPDPTIDSEGRPYFDVSNAGITHQYTHSSLFESKDRECERLVGGSAGVPVPLG